MSLALQIAVLEDGVAYMKRSRGVVRLVFGVALRAHVFDNGDD